MNIAEARAYNDGMEFYADNIVIRAVRDKNGDIKVTRENKMKSKEKPSIYIRILTVVITILASLIYEFVTPIDWRLTLASIFGLIWFSAFSFYFIESKNLANKMSFKYHAAEHKILNYFDKFKIINFEYKQIMEMDSISFRCGSTIVAVVLIFATLVAIGCIIFPWLIVKIIWFAASVYFTLWLWANGKCDFFQKMVLIEPSKEEIEVAAFGVWEYVKLKAEKKNLAERTKKA